MGPSGQMFTEGQLDCDARHHRERVREGGLALSPPLPTCTAAHYDQGFLPRRRGGGGRGTIRGSRDYISTCLHLEMVGSFATLSALGKFKFRYP